MKRLLTTLICLLIFAGLHAQTEGVSINASGADPDASAILDVQSSSKGMLIPRMTSKDRDAITAPVPGLMIYNLDDSCFNYYSGSEWINDCGISLDVINGAHQPLSAGSSSADAGYEIVADESGNYLVAGRFSNSISFGSKTVNSGGGPGNFLAKFNQAGEVLWATGFGSTKEPTLALDASGNSYITGNFYGPESIGDTILNSAGSGFPDIVIAKFSPSGNLIWAQRIGSVQNEFAEGACVDDFGNYYLTGHYRGTVSFGDSVFTSTSVNESDIFILKMDPNGQILWAQSGYGSGQMGGMDIDTDINGNVLATGYFENNVNFNGTTLTSAGDDDIYLVKYSPGGQLTWARNAGGAGSDVPHGIISDAGGNVYITGKINGTVSFGSINLTSGTDDGFVAKYSSSGLSLWARDWGGLSSFSNEKGNGISVDDQGNTYVTGHLSGNLNFAYLTAPNGTYEGAAYVVKHDSTGQGVWVKAFGNQNPVYGGATGRGYLRQALAIPI